jgi:hypothetical protein
MATGDLPQKEGDKKLLKLLKIKSYEIWLQMLRIIICCNYLPWMEIMKKICWDLECNVIRPDELLNWSQDLG